MQLTELLDYYLCVKINNPRTAKNYQSIVHLFSNYCHDIPVNNINYLHIKQWKDEILQQASPVTWNTYLRHMKALFKFALKKKLLWMILLKTFVFHLFIRENAKQFLMAAYRILFKPSATILNPIAQTGSGSELPVFFT